MWREGERGGGRERKARVWRPGEDARRRAANGEDREGWTGERGGGARRGDEGSRGEGDELVREERDTL